MNRSPSPAVFLDRDGVIIHNRAGYVRSWDDVRIYPYALPALAILAKSAYKIVLITNQSAIGRGLVTQETVADINRRLVDIILTTGGRIDGLFFCPHAPQEACDCRKPQPGLIFQAAESLNLDLRRSQLIGDALSDLQAGSQAGLTGLILVLTGRGKKQLRKANRHDLPPFAVEKTIWHAVRRLIIS